MIKLKNLISESHHMNSYDIGPSTIHGKGVIAIKMIPTDTKLLMHIHSDDFNKYAYTDLGYYINHSETPNCEIMINNNRRFVRTLQDIHPDEELTCNYWNGPDDLERPDSFKKTGYQENGLRKSYNWNAKEVTNVSEPYIKYVLTRR